MGVGTLAELKDGLQGKKEEDKILRRKKGFCVKCWKKRQQKKRNFKPAAFLHFRSAADTEKRRECSQDARVRPRCVAGGGKIPASLQPLPRMG
jgi:hypothetical protein